MHLTALLQLSALAAVGFAHPGEHHERMSEHEFSKRELASRSRHLVARNCASQVSAYTTARKAKRALLRKRALEARDVSSASDVTATSSAIAPHYSTLQNFTCITAPEVTEGPYYINNEFVRQNLVESQPGVQLVMDIGILDINTCEVVENAFVELWGANATGVYGGYAATLGGEGGGTDTNDTSSASSGGSMSAGASAMSMSMGAVPSGSAGGGDSGGGGAGMSSSSLERNETFLRGGWATNENGLVEITTIYPGFYSGRTPHIHTMVHLNWTESANGTLVSHSGNVIHVGQFFFNETWNDEVFATASYTNNTNTRTYNDDDSILAEENSDGNDAYLELELLGDTVSDGILGYITIGVDTTASYSITNTNFLNATSAEAASSEAAAASASSVSARSSTDSSSAADTTTSSSAGVSSFDSFFVRAIGGILGDWY